MIFVYLFYVPNKLKALNKGNLTQNNIKFYTLWDSSFAISIKYTKKSTIKEMIIFLDIKNYFLCYNFNEIKKY